MRFSVAGEVDKAEGEIFRNHQHSFNACHSSDFQALISLNVTSSFWGQSSLKGQASVMKDYAVGPKRCGIGQKLGWSVFPLKNRLQPAKHLQCSQIHPYDFAHGERLLIKVYERNRRNCFILIYFILIPWALSTF